MTRPSFLRLNASWNADPNDSKSFVDAADSMVWFRFLLNRFAYDAQDGEFGCLIFSDCFAWRLGETNDHGWYSGQCRYSRTAPEWGEFYELTGEDDLRDRPTDWRTPPVPGRGNRHFLFYLRDETFECIAADWRFERDGTRG